MILAGPESFFRNVKCIAASRVENVIQMQVEGHWLFLFLFPVFENKDLKFYYDDQIILRDFYKTKGT